MTRLYDIQQNILNVLDEVALQDGEITPLQEEALRLLEESKYIKLKNYVRYFRNLDSDIDEIDGEVDRLRERRLQIVRGKERLLAHVGRMLGDDGHFEDPVAGELKWNKPTGRLEVNVAPEQLPDKYLTRYEACSVDTEQIKKDLKAGHKVEGAKLVFERVMRYVAPRARTRASDKGISNEHQTKGQ